MTPYFKRFLKNQKPSELIKIREFVENLIIQKMQPIELLELRPRHHKKLLDKMAEYWGIKSEAAFSKRRHPQEMKYKHAVRYAIRTATGMPFEEIGRMFNCNHATIMHSMSFVEKSALINSDYFENCKGLIKFLKTTIHNLNEENYHQELLKNLKK